MQSMKTRPSKIKRNHTTELEAVQKFIELLEPLAKEDRTRLLRTVAEFFSIRL